MKRLILCLVLVFSFAQFSYLVAQEEEVFINSLTSIPATITSMQGPVVALSVNIVNSHASLTPYPVIGYTVGQTWYMQIVYVNTSSSTQSCKLEFDLRYQDGVGYKVYRNSASILGRSVNQSEIVVTSYVAKRGLLTLTGRVYGAGMGNDNKVTSQVYVY